MNRYQSGLVLCVLLSSSCYNQQDVQTLSQSVILRECSGVTDKYDGQFRLAALTYWPPLYSTDWGWLKAQCYVESHFREKARSHANAQGLCQFLPTTWRDVEAELGTEMDILNAHDSITASGYYMGKLMREWAMPDIRTVRSHRRLSQASYNGGLGTVLKGQRKAGGALEWAPIEQYLPKESQEYPIKIEAAHTKICMPQS